MIQEIVEHINTVMLEDLGFLTTPMKHGMADRLQLIGKDNTGADLETRIYPAEYCGNDEYKDLSDFDKRQGLLYHRVVGTVSSAEGDNPNAGCAMQLVKEYPMRMVACIKKSLIGDFQYSDIELAESLSNLISSTNVFALNSTLNAETITIVPTEYNTDRYVVWGEETAGIKMLINFTFSLVSVNYTATVTADADCFVNLCDPVNQAYAT